MKLTIQEIKKETFRLLDCFFGLNPESRSYKIDSLSNSDIRQTPDFFNSRTKSRSRKNFGYDRFP